LQHSHLELRHSGSVLRPPAPANRVAVSMGSMILSIHTGCAIARIVCSSTCALPIRTIFLVSSLAWCAAFQLLHLDLNQSSRCRFATHDSVAPLARRIRIVDRSFPASHKCPAPNDPPTITAISAPQSSHRIHHLRASFDDATPLRVAATMKRSIGKK